MHKFIVIFLFLISVFQVHGQLVTTGSSATNLIQNVLVGSGVTVSNVTFNGVSQAIGSFTASGTNLGINSGIIITTGTIAPTAAGPQGPNNQQDAGVDNGAPGSSILTNIIGNTTYDASVIQFNVVPYADTVRFKYVFASEEYLEYCGTPFNDIFGFFISGPGIVPDGSFGNYRNIARIPGSGQTVAINNVHSAVSSNINGNSVPAQNAGYYVNNNGGSTIQYDGFTVPLEAISKVQCGQTYNLIIAIADVGDGIYDSGIFLEANSLTSKTPVEIDFELSALAFNDDDLMAEGCTDVTFTLTRENNLNQALTIPINLTGSAVEIADYTNVPNSITFPAGQSQVQFTFTALEDGLSEGIENILLEFLLTDPCGNVTPIFREVRIQDVFPLSVEIINDTVVCSGDDGVLVADVTGGTGSYTFLWSNGESTESITINPPATQTYTVVVTDNCINGTANATGQVVVPIYPPIVLTITDDITEICPYIPAELSVQATGGTGTYTYQWTSSQGETLGIFTNQTVTPSQTTTYSVLVTDACGVVDSADVLYTITSPPLIVEMSPGVEVCPGDSVHITTTVTGGYGDYFYVWPHSNETTPDVWVNPWFTTNYNVIVSDECQTFTVPGNTTITVVKPIADFIPSSHTLFDSLPITFQNLSINGLTYQWEFGDGNTSTLVHPNNVFNEPGTYMVTLIATDAKGCIDSIQKPITILEAFYLYVPNTFTPNDGDRFNNYFSASVYGIAWLEVEIYNRWGEQVYSSDNLRFKWDGTYKNSNCQDGTYTYVMHYKANNGFEEKIVGHVNIIR